MMGSTFDIMFFPILTCHVTEAGKVENYRFVNDLRISKKIRMGVIFGPLHDAIPKFPV